LYAANASSLLAPASRAEEVCAVAPYAVSSAARSGRVPHTPEASLGPDIGAMYVRSREINEAVTGWAR
jgi:hypothetical protein